MTGLPRAFFTSSVVLLVVLALAVPTIEPGSSAFVISVLTAGMLLVTLVGSALLVTSERDPFEALGRDGEP